MMMTLMIVLSVAMLPAAGSVAPIVKSASQDVSESKDMTMASDMSGAMDECRPDHAKAEPCDRSSERCPTASCAGQPVTIASASVVRFDLPFVTGRSLPIPVDQVVALRSGSPLFRPPRI
jgi:hypothetical protein